MTELEPITGEDGVRLRALRHLLGYIRLRDFVEALNRPGLGFDTLGDVERGTRSLSTGECFEITEFCGVGRDWFSMPLYQHGHAFATSPEVDSNREVLVELHAMKTALNRVLANRGPLADLIAATPDAPASREPRD